MWARKRIDLNGSGLLTAAGYCLLNTDAESGQSRIADCFYSDQLLTTLSVRSGFDLALQTLAWPVGSEIIFSGYTIPDMPRIAVAHGLVPVGVDIDWKTLAPSIESIEAAITPRTRAIVIAHLMGGLCDLRDVVKLARRHDLMLIEDCAQAYFGNQFQGNHDATLSMFSFGPIKTNTALGGGVLFVRNQELLTDMNSLQSSWPLQTRTEYAKRICKYSFVKFLSTWPMAALIRIGFRMFRTSHDGYARKLARSFPGDGFLTKIRKRPSAAMLRFLARRIENYSDQKVARRRDLGNRLANALMDGAPALPHLGFRQLGPTHWVFALLVENPDSLAQHLWDHGFDATTHSSLEPVGNENSMAAIDASLNSGQRPVSSSSDLPTVNTIHQHIVYLPLDIAMPPAEITRLAKTIQKTNARLPEEFALALLNEQQNILELQLETRF